LVVKLELGVSILRLGKLRLLYGAQLALCKSQWPTGILI
jgi:hypothetical protein